MTFKLNIAEISDIHLGHHKTSTFHILQNLRQAFPDNAITGALDVIFIAGDAFDRLLNLPFEEVLEIRIWIAELLSMCKRRNILLRVLEGTRSHDWKQSSLFTSINSIANIGADVRHVTTLSIEYIEAFGINVLYVPDEWAPEPASTQRQVVELLAVHGLEQVDFTIMHGAFPHQLPPVMAHTCHDPYFYSKITARYVFIGHVHQRSQWRNILASGSFDRMIHGDEGSKGYLLVNILGDTAKITFMENTNAMVFLTVECFDMPLAEALASIDAAVAVTPGHYRIKAWRDDPIANGLDNLRIQYPKHNWSLKLQPRNQNAADTGKLKVRYTPTAINAGNVKEAVTERLKRMELQPGVSDAVLAILETGVTHVNAA